jgi:hypothetical protein
MALLVPTLGSAQVLYRPTPPPPANAAAAQWQVQGEPLLHAGIVYLPTGPSVFFDGNRMVRVGEYLGVPLYADTTLEPFSVVYVPVAGGLMKPYERPRTGDLSGTVGSRTPALPVPPGGAGADLRRPAVPAQASAPPRPVAAPPGPAIVVEAAEGGNRTAGTSGTAGSLASLASASTPQAASAPVRSRVETIPPAATNEGLWVEYEGRRWYSAGPAVAFSPDRFTPVGDHHGFPVYRERSGAPETIYVTVVTGGPLAPYAAR